MTIQKESNQSPEPSGDLRQRHWILWGVARMVSRGIRQTDLIARRIETDFGMLLLYADGDGGCSVAERIGQQVEENVRDGERNNRKVTVSIGIRSLCSRNCQPERLLASADKALYKAKARGGNQFALLDGS